MYMSMVRLCILHMHTYACQCYRLVLKIIYYVGSNILKEKYDTMVDAINSGVVDETKATCKTNFSELTTHLN